jgi:hypothetical protein
VCSRRYLLRRRLGVAVAERDTHAPNFVVRGLVEDLRVRCRFGLLCPERESDRSGGAAAAGDEDADEPDVCVRDENGCEEALPLDAVTAHEAACGFAPATCAFTTAEGGACGARTRRRDDHAAACPHRPAPCARGCGALLPPGCQERHEEASCPETLLLCGYVNCGTHVRRCEQAAHDAQYLQQHLTAERAAREAYARAAATAEGAGAHDALLAALHSSKAGADAATAAAALARLTLCAVAPAAQPAAWRAACGAACAVMRAHPTSAAVQLHGCAALRWLAPALADDGGDAAAPAVTTLLAALSVHASDAAVTAAACAALASVACSSAAAVAANAGAIPALLAVLSDTAAPELAVEKACAALERVAWSGDDAYTELLDAAAVRTALQMLYARADSSGARLAAAAWLLLHTLMHDNGDATAAAVRDGAAPLALSVLSRHALHADVQLQALAALRVLTKDGGDAAAALGAEEAAYEALSRHGCNAGVLEQALCLAGALRVDNGALRTLRTDAPALIVAAMGTHAQAARTQRDCIYAINQAMLSRPEDARAVAAAGCIQAIVVAMRTHVCNAELLREACAALQQIFSHNELDVTAAHAGGVAHMLFSALRAHPAAPALHAAVCIALTTVVCGVGGAPLVEACVREHSMVEMLLCLLVGADAAAAHAAARALTALMQCLGRAAPPVLLPHYAESALAVVAAATARSADVAAAAADALLQLHTCCAGEPHTCARVMTAIASALDERAFSDAVARRRQNAHGYIVLTEEMCLLDAALQAFRAAHAAARVAAAAAQAAAADAAPLLPAA